MNIQKAWLFAAALGGVVLATAASPDEVSYSTRCAVIDDASADGYVTNESRDTYQVSGQVRFVFSAQNDIARPEMVLSANILIPPGQTVLAARIKLAFQPPPGEKCRFDVSDALSKL